MGDPLSFKQSHEMQTTLREYLRELPDAIGHLDYEVSGNQIFIRDKGRRLIIDLNYEGIRHLGSLDLPMTKVDYEFIGYTQKEMDTFMEHLQRHILRFGG